MNVENNATFDGGIFTPYFILYVQYIFVLSYPVACIIRQGRGWASVFRSTKLFVFYHPAYCSAAM